MKKYRTSHLYVGQQCLFQFSNWAPSNLKRVKIRYVSSTYVIMFNLDTKEEYCVKLDSDEIFLKQKSADFYEDPNGVDDYQ